VFCFDLILILYIKMADRILDASIAKEANPFKTTRKMLDSE
jgi:hypothetical protein